MPGRIHIFFDLDRTLWDYETNSTESLREIFSILQLQSLIPSPDDLIAVFQSVHVELWRLFHLQEVDKVTLRKKRFELTFNKLGVNNLGLCAKAESYFISNTPRKKTLFPGAVEVLEKLHKKYPLHIITNGFEGTQQTKLASSGLERFFEEVVTSERAAARKPSVEIFQYALNQAGAKPENSIMVGDDPHVDIAGGRAAGLTTILYNTAGIIHQEQPDYELTSLYELPLILEKIKTLHV